MIQELQKYPKSWGEFVKWWRSLGYGYWQDSFGIFYSDTNRTASTPELQKALIEWLDSKWVVISVKFNIPNEECRFYVEIDTEEYNEILEYFPTRQQATEAGILKAFEILESK